MGLIYGIRYKLSRKSAENIFPNILAQAAVCPGSPLSLRSGNAGASAGRLCDDTEEMSSPELPQGHATHA